MKIKLVILLLFSISAFKNINAQNYSIKTNILGDITTSINIGAETKLSSKSSVELVSSINLWEFSKDKKIKHLLLQPAIRYWMCEYRNGAFCGVHLHWAHFNAGGVKLPLRLFPNLEESRYQGNLFGGGLSIGYSWMISKSFDIETELGLGYARIIYDKYPCRHCSLKSYSGKYNYWGATKIAVRLVYSF